MDIKSIAELGLSLAENSRRNQDDLDEYWDIINGKGIGDHKITFRDIEDGQIYTKTLDMIPYMGNKSARLVEIIGDRILNAREV